MRRLIIEGSGSVMPKRKEETFVVRIQECKNSTWQGSILWAEKQQRQYFRSALELLCLLEEAVEKDRKVKVSEGGSHEE